MHLAYQCSFLFVCFVGLYAGHPYILLISFEIFLLACYNNNYRNFISFTILRFNCLAVLTPRTLVSCPQLSPTPATFTCKTTTGALLWIQDNLQSFFSTFDMVGDNGSLGYFTTRLDGVEGLQNLTSTATTDVFFLPSSITNITIMCRDPIGGEFESAVLIVNGMFQ